MASLKENGLQVSSCVTELTKHCVLHASLSLAPRGVKLPSGSHRIEQFCQETLNIILNNTKSKKKKTPHLPLTTLVPEVDILSFYEGVSTIQEFTEKVCNKISSFVALEGSVDETKILEHCWSYYSEQFKAEIAYPKWLNSNDSFRLWLVFCSNLSALSFVLDGDIMNELLQQIVKKAGFTWDESFEYKETSVSLEFPVYLKVLTECYDSLQIDTAVVSEIANDIKDEIVDGVLRKGYIYKKGHKVHNWRRRFFILTRKSLMYHESREKMNLKGSITINEHTKTETLEDKGERKHKFSVTCGSTGIKYVMSADNSIIRNEWILAIAKAMQLEQAFSQQNEREITSSIASFYQLKYGTTSPKLKRIDSTIRHASVASSAETQSRIKKLSESNEGLPVLSLSPTKQNLPSIQSNGTHKEDDDDEEEEENKEILNQNDDELYYETMVDSSATQKLDASNDDADDDDGYTYMFQGKDTDVKKSLDEATVDIIKEAAKASLETKKSLIIEEKAKTDAEEERIDIQGDVFDDSSVYEECTNEPRYILNKRDNELTASKNSYLESISEYKQEDTPNAMGNKKESDGYLPILPRHNSSTNGPPDSSPLPPLRTSSAKISPLSSPTRSSRNELELYYITPPPIPAHHRTRGSTPS